MFDSHASKRGTPFRSRLQRAFDACGAAAAVAALLLASSSADAQKTATIGFKSVGRGAPLARAIPRETRRRGSRAKLEAYPENDRVVGPWRPTRRGANGELVRRRLRQRVGRRKRPTASSRCRSTSSRRRTSTTTARCGATRATSAATARGRSKRSSGAYGGVTSIGSDPPRTAAWGYCDRDYPRAAIVSPYGFKTAQAHYEALLDETRGRGGPTQHTYATVPGELERAATCGRAGRTGTRSCSGTSIRRSSRCSPRSTRRGWCRRRITTRTRTRRSGRRSTAGPRASCGAGTITASRTSRTRSS